MGWSCGDGFGRGLSGVDSCFRRNDGVGWLGVGEMAVGTGWLVWVAGFGGMTGGGLMGVGRHGIFCSPPLSLRR